MDNRVTKKTHRFVDCSGFPCRASLEERHERSTRDMKAITCGACKHRVLDMIARQDWSQLTGPELEILEVAAAQAE